MLFRSSGSSGLVRPARPELPDLEVQSVILEQLVRQGRLDRRVPLGIREQLETLVLLESRVSKETLVPLDPLVPLEILDLLAILALLAQLVRLVLLDRKEILDRVGQWARLVAQEVLVP